MTTRETFNYFGQLIKDLFSRGDHKSNEEMAKIRGFLWTRSWIIYSIIIMDKLYKVARGNVYW